MTHKNSLLRNIWTRKERIEKYKLLYGEDSEKFKKQQHTNLLAIKRLEKSHKQLEEGDRAARELGKSVGEFFTLSSPKGPVHYKFNNSQKRIFFRYGLENRIPASALSRYLGATAEYAGVAGKSRKTHIKKCREKPEIREEWNRFNLYMQDL